MADGTGANYYFVDEAGDLTLFGRRGKVLVGTPGCSKTFMIGVAHLADPQGVEKELATLRAELLSDPYFKDVPSMQPGAKKTAMSFHAKNDLPEVRREVLKLLPSFGAKVQVAVRRKSTLVSLASYLHLAGRRLQEDDIYDDLVKRLFRNLLHKAEWNHIFFARRGKKDRTAALTKAIEKAKANFEARFGWPSERPTTARCASPSACPGLQVIDYYLWALQRLYERGEDRFFELLRQGYRLIMDLDDKRNKAYGEWYSDSNPLELRKMEAL